MQWSNTLTHHLWVMYMGTRNKGETTRTANKIKDGNQKNTQPQTQSPHPTMLRRIINTTTTRNS